MRRATKAKKDESDDGKLMVEDQQSCCRKIKNFNAAKQEKPSRQQNLRAKTK